MMEAQDEAFLAEYGAWRRSRLAARMELAGEQRVWNHLITVFIFGATHANADALARTLSSLANQSYRNVEIVVAGVREAELPDPADYAHLRGLFAEPALDVLGVLSDPVVDHLWRGGHVVFAVAGTVFDSDSFAQLNRMLSPSRGVTPPDLIVCDHDRAAGAAPQPCFLPGWDPDLIVEMDYIGTAFMASRKLVHARRLAQRPDSFHDWLCGLAGSSVAVGHLAEPVMELPVAMPRRLEATAARIRLSSPRSLAIIIPNRDRPELLRRCVNFLKFLEGPVPEVVIVDHSSSAPATLALYAELQEQHRARVLRVEGRFNFSRMINLGVAATSADVVVLLNNDVEITDPSQVDLMVGHAIRPEVGVVGARLLYPDGTVQHSGMILRAGKHAIQPVSAQHVLRGAPGHADGYLDALRTVRNYQAVTGALIATRRTVFDQAGGFDEVNLPVEYNDVDYCLRVRAMGHRVIVVPTEGMIHSESSTRGTTAPPEVDRMRAAAMHLIAERWGDTFDHDPFSNPHLDLGDRAQVMFPWANKADRT